MPNSQFVWLVGRAQDEDEDGFIRAPTMICDPMPADIQASLQPRLDSGELVAIRLLRSKAEEEEWEDEVTGTTLRRADVGPPGQETANARPRGNYINKVGRGLAKRKLK